ncbi:MAG: hypothetical protein ACHQHN_04225 [Sphingobacteriales bacterium]
MMKKLIVPILMLLVFAACTKKDAVTPKKVVIVPVYDTIPDGGIFSFYAVRDSTYYDWTGFNFNHKYSLKTLEGDYIGDSDIAYFMGYDPVKIWTITDDGYNLEEDHVPYIRGMSFKLHVENNENTPMYMKLHAYVKIPPTIHIWCKDNYLKDSVDMIPGVHINFTIDHTIPASYSDDRFQVVLWSDRKN